MASYTGTDQMINDARKVNGADSAGHIRSLLLKYLLA